jgi:hypothetical protein
MSKARKCNLYITSSITSSILPTQPRHRSGHLGLNSRYIPVSSTWQGLSSMANMVYPHLRLRQHCRDLFAYFAVCISCSFPCWIPLFSLESTVSNVGFVQSSRTVVTLVTDGRIPPQPIMTSSRHLNSRRSKASHTLHVYMLTQCNLTIVLPVYM